MDVEIHDEKGMNSPVASFIGEPKEVSDRYRFASPIELLPLNINQIIIHGELDLHVPVDLSVEYHRKAIEQGDKVQLIVLPDVEHFKLINLSSTAWETVTNSLKTLFEV